MPTKRKLAVLLIKDKQLIISHFYLINIHIFDYPDSRLSGQFTEVPMSPDNRGLTVPIYTPERREACELATFCRTLLKCHAQGLNAEIRVPIINASLTKFLFEIYHLIIYMEKLLSSDWLR